MGWSSGAASCSPPAPPASPNTEAQQSQDCKGLAATTSIFCLKSAFYKKKLLGGSAMPFMLLFSWCSPLQPHLLFKGVLIGVHTSSHLTLSTDLGPKSILRALHPLLLTSFQLLPCFSISECFNAHGLVPFCNWRMYRSLNMS